MKATVSALLALLLVAAPLAGIVLANEDAPEREALPEVRDLQVVVTRGETSRFGGGSWVAIQVGDTLFAVMYGTEDRPNHPRILVMYDRYLGMAEIYNETGSLLAERPIPVRTVVTQSFHRMVEFEDGDGDGLFHFPSRDDFLNGTADIPLKALTLRQAWSLEDFSQRDEGDTTTVDFNVTARDLPYEWPRDAEGSLDRITFAFHVTVDRVERQVDFDVYRIVVDENRHIVERSLVRTDNVTGVTVDGQFKYDHYIEGWDFESEDSLLALTTHVTVGNHVPPVVARWLHMELDARAHADDEDYHRDTTLERPRLVTGDQMRFEDEWTRVGRLHWVSHVEVDGAEDEMRFQLFWVERVSGIEGLYNGVLFAGAFIYPQGDVIFHDPELQATFFLPGALAEGLGLAPYLIQLGLVSLVVVGLVLYRAVRRKPQP